MTAIRGNYRHYLSREPRPIRAEEIRAFAGDIRRQVLGAMHRHAADVREVAGRIGSLVVNGVAFSLVWDFDNAVHDEDGNPVMGVCEHDPAAPGQVMISINAAMIGDHPELERSTAIHELGHALFDMPAAIHAERQLCLEFGGGGPGRRSFRLVSLRRAHQRDGADKGPIDWREWRANEFMGAFLAPPVIFHQHLLRLANAAGLTLTHRPSSGKPGLPVIDVQMCNPGDLEAVIDALADQFGVSSEFVRVRMQKYRLAAGREGWP